MSETNDNRPSQDIRRFINVAKSLAAEKDLDKLLELITHSATYLLDAERSSLYLYDAKSKTIVTRILEADEIKQVRLPLGQGIAGAVAETHTLINIPDCYTDDRFDPSWDKKTGYHTRNMLCAPMLNHENDLMGVLQVLNKQDGPFTSSDEDRILALGGLAAVSLDNDRLVQHYLEKKKIEHSLDIARTIQQSLLPKKLPVIENVELAAFCQPCDKTGGDYYDFLPLEDGRLGLVIGDVTGHGIGPAILMSETRALVRAGFLQSKSIEQTMLTTNAQLVQDMTEGRFVTMFFGLIDPTAKTLQYASAGHASPFLYRRRTGQFEELLTTSPPLGIISGIDFPTGDTITLEPGDIMLLTTDGIEEAMDKELNPFGRGRIAQAIQDLQDPTPDEVIGAVRTTLQSFLAGAPLHDDMTMIAIRMGS